jgi:hypothetical protein
VLPPLRRRVNEVCKKADVIRAEEKALVIAAPGKRKRNWCDEILIFTEGTKGRD